ncbi:MAG: ECF transporter S component [Ruminococcaceae bacterium]|nr:ECF transporter S component [Oscillospiraceae bacterium]
MVTASLMPRDRIRRIAIDGMLCAVAVVGRIALGALPNIQPVTAIIILMAIYIGIWDSVVSSVVVVIVTNAYLGFGIWTVYQIIAWAAIGVVSGLLFRKHHHPLVMLGWAALCGFLYGAVISIFSWNAISTGAAAGYVAYWLSGLLFDGYHAAGNAVFIWFLQPLFEKLVKKE